MFSNSPSRLISPLLKLSLSSQSKHIGHFLQRVCRLHRFSRSSEHPHLFSRHMTMQALKFEKTGSLDNLSLVNIEKPSLRPGEALVRVRAAGVNGVSLQLGLSHTRQAV